MRIGDFEFTVVGGREDSNGYVALSHGSTFKVQCRNYSNRRGDMNLTINGVDQGTWRINAYSSLYLERPAHEQALFTFFKADSVEGDMVGAQSVSEHARGLVTARFTPEVVRQPLYRSPDLAPMGSSSRNMDNLESYSTRSKSTGPATLGSSLNYSAPSNNYEEGIVGLTGHSNQRFGTAESIEYDLNSQIAISLRLVALNNAPRPLTPAVPMSNGIPAPVKKHWR